MVASPVPRARGLRLLSPLFAVLFAMLLPACASSPGQPATPEPSRTPITKAELRQSASCAAQRYARGDQAATGLVACLPSDKPEYIEFFTQGTADYLQYENATPTAEELYDVWDYELTDAAAEQNR